MRAARVALGTVLLMLLSSTIAIPMSAGASMSAGARNSTSSASPTVSMRGATLHPQLADPSRQARRWAPASGLVLNDPMVPRRRRVILAKVIRSINQTAKRETIRIVTWNLDDRPVAGALINAKRRGVVVKVVVSGVVDNANWTRLKRQLNRNKTDKSYARQCRGACRSRAGIMHSKLYLFSRIHGARYISMLGSSNLTTPAGNRQWNDLVTTRKYRLYKYFVKTFGQYARDKPVRSPYDVFRAHPYRATLFPAPDRNPVVDELRKVRCRGATGGTGNASGRTQIRIAIAGWFDVYGGNIADQLRVLWDRGCDVKIVTTLAGRSVNRALRNKSGRGPVPIREVTVDNNDDGIPERYLHLKVIALSGVYGGDSSASLVLTGSPNWSARAQRSDEVWVRILGRGAMVHHYQGHVDRLYASPWAHARMTAQAQLQRSFRTVALPTWFEMD